MKRLTLVLLLAALPSLTLTEVVKSFPGGCPSFFMLNSRGNGPTIFPELQYKMICQCWKEKYRFATLYDTERRIPVYSAYTFSQKVTTESRKCWKIEPQLETQIKGYEDIKEMMDSSKAEEDITHQAVNTDYKGQVINNTNYTRGHVFPCGYAGNQDQADSTFTLTNIAPQSNKNNGKWSKQVETTMLNEIIDKCSLKNQPAYIVTGVVPGHNWLKIKRNNKIIEKGINIPSHFWSAFCCKIKKGKLVSGAYIAEQGEFKLSRPSIDNLNKRLTELYKRDFKVFPGLKC